MRVGHSLRTVLLDGRHGSCTGIERNDLQDVCVFVYRHDKVMLWSCKARDIRDVDQSGLSEGTVLLRTTVPPAILRIHGPRVTHVEEFLRFLTKLLQASTAVLRCHGPLDYRPVPLRASAAWQPVACNAAYHAERAACNLRPARHLPGSGWYSAYSWAWQGQPLGTSVRWKNGSSAVRGTSPTPGAPLGSARHLLTTPSWKWDGSASFDAGPPAHPSAALFADEHLCSYGRIIGLVDG